MKILIKIFAVLIILNCANVEAATSDGINFQELRARVMIPTPPDRIRHRNDSRRIQRPSPPRIEPKEPRVSSRQTYTQRQPKRPAPIHTPKLPQKKLSPPRGAKTPKKFGPPRF